MGESAVPAVRVIDIGGGSFCDRDDERSPWWVVG